MRTEVFPPHFDVCASSEPRAAGTRTNAKTARMQAACRIGATLRSVAEAVNRLGQSEPTGPEGAADNGALATEVAERSQVVEGGDPARGEHGDSGVEHLGEQLDVGALERAVPPRAGYEQPVNSGGRTLLGESLRRHLGLRHPSVDHDFPVLRVDGNHDLVGEASG